jgi:hypothetical protein
MRKLLNAAGILILSMCVLSCSKDEEPEAPLVPISKEEAVGGWIIQENPVIEIAIVSQEEKAKDLVSQLKTFFQKGDKYLFNDDLTCSITRGTSKAGPETYKIEGSYLIFDNYIKFLTDKSDTQLSLTAGDTEIKDIVREKLKDEYEDPALTLILKAVSGKIKIVLEKESN